MEELSPIRQAALRLIKAFVPCDTGDQKFLEVAKDFQGGGTTCGFLCHWLMWRLGCRDPKVVNRAAPPELRYVPGKNISRIFSGGAFTRWKKGLEPKPGDIIFISNGPPLTEHVFVLVERAPQEPSPTSVRREVWRSADGGQKNDRNKECMRFKNRVYYPDSGKLETSPGYTKQVHGWIDIDKLVKTAPLQDVE